MNVLFCLLRKIIAFKKMNKRIEYSTFPYEIIYHELGYENSTKINKFKLRQRIKAILDAWKGSTIGDIKLTDYKENKRGDEKRWKTEKIEDRQQNEPDTTDS